MNQNLACRIFAEQLKLVNQLPENERAIVLYTAINQSFSKVGYQVGYQDDKQNGYQNGYQNESAYYLNHLSEESIKVLNNINIPVGDLNKGDNHWNWKGGITPENKKERSSYKYQKWRVKVLERDGYSCQGCGCNKNLEVHHIKKFSSFDKERESLENGITLCKRCHIELHKKEGF